MVNSKTKLIATAHVSNVLGCEAPVAEIVELARKHGAKVLLDSCQSLPHMPVDVQTLGVDWIVASGHKMCGPTGIGFLWGRMDVLETMPPWMGGGASHTPEYFFQLNCTSEILSAMTQVVSGTNGSKLSWDT